MKALSIPELNRIKDRDFDTWSALVKIVQHLNAQQTQAVVGGRVLPPAMPTSLVITAIGGGFSILVGPPLGATAGLLTYIEVSTLKTFDPSVTHVYSLGNAKGFTAARDGITTFYFRCRCKYEDSDYGPFLYYGTQANPTGIA